MDAGLKTKWVAALRSGKYEQGQKRLRSDDDKYCCLGVLCDVINPNVWRRHEFTNEFMWGDSCNTVFFYTKELKELKLNDSDQAYFMGLNDQEKHSFSEIADYIERTSTL